MIAMLCAVLLGARSRVATGTTLLGMSDAGGAVARIAELRSAFHGILDSKVRRCETRRPGPSVSEFGTRQREIRG